MKNIFMLLIAAVLMNVGNVFGQADTTINGVPYTLFSPGLWVEVEDPVLEIGMEYQGGIIAYILQDGDPGYVANETHGIIAAPSDQSAGIQWGSFFIPTGATGTALGTGQANTTAIVDALGGGSYAAKLCDDLVLGGYADWYLPSKDELNKLYENRAAVGGFADAHYWSSSEVNAFFAYTHNFAIDDQFIALKESVLRVRAVRSF